MLLLLFGALSAELFLLEVNLNTSHSEKVEQFYHSVGQELRYFYNAAKLSNTFQTYYQRSYKRNNLSTSTQLAIYFSRRQIALNRWRLTPITTLAFSRKEIEFAVEEEMTILFFHNGSVADQTITSFYAGISPEFSRFGKQRSGKGTRYMALRPLGRLTRQYSHGHLNGAKFSTAQIGTEVQLGLTRTHSTHTGGRGVSFTMSALYERAILGDRHMKTVYGYIIDRTISYPKESLHLGIGLSFTYRRFRKGENS